jgi:predicted nuclease of predicted toxin-antitoxin system
VRVLFDHNVPKKLRTLLPGHEITTSRELRWDALKNGELIDAAEASSFECLLTGDKNLSYQQNLQGRKLALVVLSATDWNTVKEQAALVAAAFDAATPGSFRQVIFEQRRGRGLSRKPQQ